MSWLHRAVWSRPAVVRCIRRCYMAKTPPVGLNIGRPPEVQPGVASALLIKLFPFKHVSFDSFKQLPSYYDRNLYFEGIHEESCSRTELKPFVLKISNTDVYTPELVDGLNKMMLFVENRGFVCGGPVASRTGQYLHMATEHELLGGGSVANGGAELEAVQYPVRVMKYIPGELMDKLDKCYLTPQLSYDVGNYVGRMDHALQEFHHSAIENWVFEWDLQHFTSLKKYIPHIQGEQKRHRVYTVMEAFEANVLPKLPSMKRGVIQNDVNGVNIILQKVGRKYELAGLIDFGASVHSCYLLELAIMLAYGVITNPVKFVTPMLHGYLDAFPLSREELNCLYYAVLARLCLSAVTGEYMFSQEPWNTYFLTTPVKAWMVIELLLALTKERVEELWGLWD